MFWLAFPFISAFGYSLSGFFDNFFVDVYCRRLNAMCMIGVYAALNLLICFGILVWRWDLVINSNLGLTEVGVFLLSAATNFLGSIPYYKALKKNDTTDVTLLVQMSPVIALVLSFVFLGEAISPMQFGAFILIFAAIMLIVLNVGKKRMKSGLKVVSLVLAACVCWVVADILFASQARGTEFITSFFWFILGGAIAQIIALIFVKSWRKDAKKFLSKNSKKKILTITINQLVWLVAAIAWRYGLTVMPVAILSVVSGVLRLVLTFLLGIILTRIWPKFGREKISKKTVINHTVAIVILAFALVMIG